MTAKAFAEAKGRHIVSYGDLELEIPRCEKGVGSVIAAPDSIQLIAGVEVAPLTFWPDDRGYFLEVQRLGRGMAADFPASTSQISAALSYPGSIKAFHYHIHQTDCWTPARGMLQVALVDLRVGSRTFGVRNTMYVGALRTWQILIPPGVAHGYRVIGGTEAMLIYMTDRFYNPQDEGRLPYNDSDINYDWETQHK